MSEIRSQATPARDELVHILAGAVLDNPGGIGTLPQHAANRILAAGWSKPRTVNSATELDALPVGAVVHSAAGTIAAKLDRTEGVVFGIHRSFQWSGLALPATVLFTPGDAG